jgi:hypothetical protein
MRVWGETPYVACIVRQVRACAQYRMRVSKINVVAAITEGQRRLSKLPLTEQMARIMIVRMSQPQRRTRLSPLSLTLLGCALFLFCSGLQAQENCNVEVKLELLSAETQAAQAALKVKKQTAGRVYFFDTDSLDLLSQGAIVRLRSGAQNDLTVKLRPPKGKTITVPFKNRDGSKCEVDLTGDGANTSYSIGRKLVAEQLPETGSDISNLLSADQKKLLNDAQISLDWMRIKRIAAIESTAWQAKVGPHFGKLSLELWEWAGGRVLELSTKVSKDGGLSAYTELQELVKTKGLSASPDQRAKTAIVLEAIVHAKPH